MDVRKLKAAMVERSVNADELAHRSGLNRALIYRRLAEPDDLSIREVKKIAAALSLTAEEANRIFFTD